MLNEKGGVETPEEPDETKPTVAVAVDKVVEGATDSTGTDADALTNQLYALPAYWESAQGMCSHSDSLGSIVVYPSLMLPSVHAN